MLGTAPGRAWHATRILSPCILWRRTDFIHFAFLGLSLFVLLILISKSWYIFTRLPNDYLEVGEDDQFSPRCHDAMPDNIYDTNIFNPRARQHLTNTFCFTQKFGNFIEFCSLVCAGQQQLVGGDGQRRRQCSTQFLLRVARDDAAQQPAPTTATINNTAEVERARHQNDNEKQCFHGHVQRAKHFVHNNVIPSASHFDSTGEAENGGIGLPLKAKIGIFESIAYGDIGLGWTN